MSTEVSAYAVLGLQPGVEWSEVEQAYKRLIKQHHPDLPGGDGGRAAEITRAYRELKRARHDSRQLALRPDDGIGGDKRTEWVWFALLAAAILMALALAVAPGSRFAQSHPREAGAANSGARAGSDPMSRPLSMAAINQAIGDAVRIARSEDEAALAARAMDCHRTLRADPRLEQFDRCAAFDDAVVQLRDRDPLRDQGPFSEIAVTGRQINAASALSGDSLAIDGRLDRIRLHVELALAPTLPPAPTENAAAAN